MNHQKAPRPSHLKTGLANLLLQNESIEPHTGTAKPFESGIEGNHIRWNGRLLQLAEDVNAAWPLRTSG